MSIRTLSLINKLNKLSKYGFIITTIGFDKNDMEDNTVYLENVKIKKIQGFEIICPINEKMKDEQIVIQDIKLNRALRKSIKQLQKYKKKGD